MNDMQKHKLSEVETFSTHVNRLHVLHVRTFVINHVT